MDGNRIPRRFGKITDMMLIHTNVDRPGDVIHVFKNECGGYSALNTRTGKYAHCFVSMLRGKRIFQMTGIEQ